MVEINGSMNNGENVAPEGSRQQEQSELPERQANKRKQKYHSQLRRELSPPRTKEQRLKREDAQKENKFKVELSSLRDPKKRVEELTDQQQAQDKIQIVLDKDTTAYVDRHPGKIEDFFAGQFADAKVREKSRQVWKKITKNLAEAHKQRLPRYLQYEELLPFFRLLDPYYKGAKSPNPEEDKPRRKSITEVLAFLFGLFVSAFKAINSDITKENEKKPNWTGSYIAHALSSQTGKRNGTFLIYFEAIQTKPIPIYPDIR